MDKVRSCSACCGIFNLRMDARERAAWIAENTVQFLALDLSKAENIVAFRREREAVTLPRRIREDTYVCPFVGYIDQEPTTMRTGSRKERPRVALEPNASMRTGCLLHPAGSPHPQIGLWQHPQNFSFYGEGICLAYDCLAKDRQAYMPEFFTWSMTAPPFAYARLASDHTLHRALQRLETRAADLRAFYSAVARAYERHQVVTTSFEDIEKSLPETPGALCLLIAGRVASARVDIDSARQERFARHLARLFMRHLSSGR